MSAIAFGRPPILPAVMIPSTASSLIRPGRTALSHPLRQWRLIWSGPMILFSGAGELCSAVARPAHVPVEFDAQAAW